MRLTHIGKRAAGRVVGHHGALRLRGRRLPGGPTTAGGRGGAGTRRARELDHWMDDPTGPHPIRARRRPIEHRRAQVPLALGLRRQRTQRSPAAPEWEEAHARLRDGPSTRAVWGQGLERLGRPGPQRRRLARGDPRGRADLTAQPDTTWRAHTPGRLGRGARAIWGAPAEAARRPRPVRSRCPSRSDPDPLRSRSSSSFGRRRAPRGPTGGHGAPQVSLAAPGAHLLRLLGLSSHVAGLLPGGGNHDQTSWATMALPTGPRGERVARPSRSRCRRTQPPGHLPDYASACGCPSTGRRLRLLASDVPQVRRAAVTGTLVVTP